MNKKQNKKNIIIITAGGTGGHLFTAQAVAEKLQVESYRVHLICDKRALRYFDYTFNSIPKTVIHSLNIKKSLISKITDISILLINFIKVTSKFLFKRPQAVIAFGSHPTIPTCLYAMLFHIPLILHEQNTVLGRVNSIFLPFAKKLFLGFPITKKINYKHINKVFITGLPIRKKIVEYNKRTHKGKSKILRILVVGGSQGAKSLSNIFAKTIYRLDPISQNRISITQQVRNEDAYYIKSIYSRTFCKYDTKPFFHNIEVLYPIHDLVITRSGSCSVIESLLFKKATIFVPLYESADNHQFINALYISKHSHVLLREEKLFSIKWLLSHIKLFLYSKEKIDDIEHSYNEKLVKFYNNSTNIFYNHLQDLINN